MSWRKKALAVTALLGLAGAAGVAYAAWTSDAEGSATAQSTTSIDSTITPEDSTADLYPGATMSVTVTIDNPNDYPVVVNSISAGSSGVVNTNCVAATVTSDARVASDATGLVQSDNATKIIAANDEATYTLVTHMSAAAVDACKSETFTLAGLTATLSSAAS
ncbi:MAG: hypothetical protein ACRDYF_02065 [Acidimicrobiia bacterium]